MTKEELVLLDKLCKGFKEFLFGKTKRKLSMTPKAKANRAKFSVNGNFARPLIKNKFLYQAWEKSKIKSKSNYNRISSINRKFCLEKNPTEQNVISPPGGFPFKLTNTEYTLEKLHLKIEPVRLNKNEKELICLLYICCYDPELTTRKYCVYYEVKQGTFKETEAEFIFDGREKTTATWYKKHIFYLCAVTLNRNENVVRWSETIAFNPDKPIEESTQQSAVIE